MRLPCEDTRAACLALPIAFGSYCTDPLAAHPSASKYEDYNERKRAASDEIEAAAHPAELQGLRNVPDKDLSHAERQVVRLLAQGLGLEPSLPTD